MASEDDLRQIQEQTLRLRRKVQERQSIAVGETFETSHPVFDGETVSYTVTQSDVDAIENEIDTLREELVGLLSTTDLSQIQL